MSTSKKPITLYHHKTDGGAEYLMSNFVVCPNGEKEGVIEGSDYIVRLDGQPELTIRQVPALDLMSDEVYVRKRGARCPVCRSDQIEGGPVEIDAGEARQPITCLNCRAEYDDIYKLFGYINLVKDGEQLA